MRVLKLFLPLCCIFALPAKAQEPLRALEARPESTADGRQYTALPANTEVVLRVNDDVTTKGGSVEEGTMFALTVASDVRVQNLVVIPRGARAMGEVTWKTGKAAFGKSGKMEVELRYIEVGGNRIDIEGKYRQEGEGNTVATVGTVVVAGVFGALVTGKSAKIPRGRELVARTRNDIPVLLPSPQGYYAAPAAYAPAPYAQPAAPAGMVSIAQPQQAGVMAIDPRSPGGPQKRPARTPSGFCYEVPRDYRGLGSLNKPALSTNTPACWQVEGGGQN